MTKPPQKRGIVVGVWGLEGEGGGGGGRGGGGDGDGGWGWGAFTHIEEQ